MSAGGVISNSCSIDGAAHRHALVQRLMARPSVRPGFAAAPHPRPQIPSAAAAAAARSAAAMAAPAGVVDNLLPQLLGDVDGMGLSLLQGDLVQVLLAAHASGALPEVHQPYCPVFMVEEIIKPCWVLRYSGETGPSSGLPRHPVYPNRFISIPP